jgi:hypothetical protein
MPTPGDRSCFDALLAALSATGEFASVTFGMPADLDAIGADRFPAAVVTPTGWTERADDAASAVRTVEFTVALVVREEDTRERFARLDRLESVALRAIDMADLGESCFPPLTRLDRGRIELALKRFEGRALLSGRFVLAVPDVRDRDVAF